MTVFEQLSLLKRLDLLIRRKATGTPMQLARRLGVSRASVFRYLNELKSVGAPIQYCKVRQSYFYEYHFELEWQWGS